MRKCDDFLGETLGVDEIELVCSGGFFDRELSRIISGCLWSGSATGGRNHFVINSTGLYVLSGVLVRVARKVVKPFCTHSFSISALLLSRVGCIYSSTVSIVMIALPASLIGQTRFSFALWLWRKRWSSAEVFKLLDFIFQALYI